MFGIARDTLRVPAITSSLGGSFVNVWLFPTGAPSKSQEANPQESFRVLVPTGFTLLLDFVRAEVRLNFSLRIFFKINAVCWIYTPLAKIYKIFYFYHFTIFSKFYKNPSLQNRLLIVSWTPEIVCAVEATE